MIELPKTIRPARLDEIPEKSVALERLQQINNAKIIEGYTFKINDNAENNDLPYKFFSEININNSRLWDLINSLMDMLPDVSTLIIGTFDSELSYDENISKSDLLKNLNKYKTELIGDAFLEWGVIYNDNETLIEIFITGFKYVRFWGVDLDRFKSILTKYDLKQIDNLEFIDEYPMVREPLRLFDNSVMDTNELFNELKK